MYSTLANAVQAWTNIDALSHVISWITNGVPIVFKDSVPAPCHIPNPVFSKRESEFIDTEVAELVCSGVLKRCKPGEVPYCVSPLKCVPKRNNKLRLIVDLRYINQHVDIPTFTQEGIQTVANRRKALLEGSKID